MTNAWVKGNERTMVVPDWFRHVNGLSASGPVHNQDALLTAELDMALVPMAQMDFDAVGHYARPDVFSLRVNTAPQQAVTLDSAQADHG
jgi:hypothetical protein